MSIAATLKANPLVPVFYNSDVEYAKRVVELCSKAGIRLFEFTNRGDDALDIFRELNQFIESKSLNISLGIGTIFSLPQAEAFIKAGAQFVVQPCIDEAVGTFCKSKQVPWIPGVITPTEVHQALSAGAEVVKLFPASSMGKSYLKSLKGPFKALQVMVTGGVKPETLDIQEWLDSGAIAVGLGSQLFKAENEDDLMNNLQLLTSTFVAKV